MLLIEAVLSLLNSNLTNNIVKTPFFFIQIENLKSKIEIIFTLINIFFSYINTIKALKKNIFFIMSFFFSCFIFFLRI